MSGSIEARLFLHGAHIHTARVSKPPAPRIAYHPLRPPPTIAAPRAPLEDLPDVEMFDFVGIETHAYQEPWARYEKA